MRLRFVLAGLAALLVVGLGQSATAGAAAPVQVSHIQKLTISEVAEEAESALTRKYRRAYSRGSRKRLSCKRRSSQAFRCNFSFRYRGKARSGTVSVKRNSAAHLEAKIKAG